MKLTDKEILEYNQLIANFRGAKYDKDTVSTRLFNIEYYNEKGTILKETQMRGKNKDDAQVHFKFFYPKKYIWKITAI